MMSNLTRLLLDFIFIVLYTLLYRESLTKSNQFWSLREDPDMPVATSTGETERHDLKSCPPDGYVVLRPMTYGEKLYRQSFTGRATVSAQKGRKDFSAEMDLMN